MTTSFGDYALGVLGGLAPPLPPLDPASTRRPLDEWRELPPIEIYELSAFPDVLPSGGLPSDGSEGEERAFVEGAIIERGFDALAFYKSIRFLNSPPFIGRWGIFIFDFSVEFLAGEIEGYYPGRWNKVDRSRKAFECLRNHELYHFRIDVWALSIEGITKKSHYETYLNRVYLPLNPNLLVVEESLANAFALRRAQTLGCSGWLREFMRAQPGAYAAFDRPQQGMQADLANAIVHGTPAAILLDRPWEHTPFIGAGRQNLVGDTFCPVYIVPGLRPSRVFPSGITIPKLKEVRDAFIPNYLAGVPVRKTDHLFVRIDNGEQIKVPNTHGNERLKMHEYKNILRKAGMFAKEFRHAREQTEIWKRACPRNPMKPPLAEDM